MNIYSSEVTFNYVEDEDMKEDGIKLTMSSLVFSWLQTAGGSAAT